MADYKLNPAQQKNADILVNEMKSQGITNPFTHAAVLAVVSKESEFNPGAAETSYATTKNDRIRSIFGKTKGLSDAQLDALKKDNKKFFDFVYNGIIGNGPQDGYNFRGRGFNQLTGRANYANISKLIGVDLVKNPDLLSQPEIAAKAMVAYFKNGINTLKTVGKLSWYNATDINDFKNINDSLGAIYHVNAGAGHNKAHLDADVTGGRAKAMARVASLYTAYTGKVAAIDKAIIDTTKSAVEAVKKNPWTVAIFVAIAVVGTIFIIKAIKKDKK